MGILQEAKEAFNGGREKARREAEEARRRRQEARDKMRKVGDYTQKRGGTDSKDKYWLALQAYKG